MGAEDIQPIVSRWRLTAGSADPDTPNYETQYDVFYDEAINPAPAQGGQASEREKHTQHPRPLLVV